MYLLNIDTQTQKREPDSTGKQSLLNMYQNSSNIFDKFSFDKSSLSGTDYLSTQGKSMFKLI